MDPITHGLIGFTLGKSVWFKPEDKPKLWAVLVGAVLPDIDYVTRLFGPLEFLAYHRGVTHSLIGMALLGLLLAITLRLIYPKTNFRHLLLSSVLGLGSHVLLDLSTSFGTQLLAPISSRRFSFDLISIIDPIFTGILLMGLTVGHFWKSRGKNVLALTLVALLLYLGVCAYGRKYAGTQLGIVLDRKRVIPNRLAVFPKMLMPFHWTVLAEDNYAYWSGLVTLKDKFPKYLTEYPKVTHNKYTKTASQLEPVKLFWWFARFPKLEYKVLDGKHIVEIFDFRRGFWYERNSSILSGIQVIMSEDGRIEEVMIGKKTLPKETYYEPLPLIFR